MSKIVKLKEIKTHQRKRIGINSMTGEVFLGRLNKKNDMWLEDKEDITSDFINICFQFFEEGTAKIIDSSGLKNQNVFMNTKKDDANIKKAISYLKGLINK